MNKKTPAANAQARQSKGALTLKGLLCVPGKAALRAVISTPPQKRADLAVHPGRAISDRVNYTACRRNCKNAGARVAQPGSVAAHAESIEFGQAKIVRTL
jgi:hypothetical protein